MKQNKRMYEQPQTEVVELRVTNQLLAGSPLGDPSDYPNGGDPLS